MTFQIISCIENELELKPSQCDYAIQFVVDH